MTEALSMANAGLELTIPVLHKMGVRFTDVGRGHATTEVPVEGNGNHLGSMYAGVLFSVAEVLGGALALNTWDASSYLPLVKSLTIDFLRPARTDVTATTSLDEDEIARTEAAAEATGKGEYILVAEIHDQDGTLVARTTGTYQIRKVG
jgi:thioesterase domain-containing protein